MFAILQRKAFGMHVRERLCRTKGGFFCGVFKVASVEYVDNVTLLN